MVPGWSAASGVSVALRNGRTMVAGQVFRGSESQIAVVRYLRNGRLDSSFPRGIFRTRFRWRRAPSSPPVSASRNEPARVIITGGYGQGRSWSQRLRPQGGLDRSFGSGGVVTTSVGGIEALVSPGRRIVVGASNANAQGRPMIVARYKRNGGLDKSYGGNGVVSRMFWNPVTTASAAVSGLVPPATAG